MVELLESEKIKVAVACRTLEVSRSGYYDWVKRPESIRAIEPAALLVRIRAVHDFSKQTYGAPRMTEMLHAEGFNCGENRVAKIMRNNNIASEAVKKFKITTTDSNHDLPISDRIFETENVDTVMAPNQVWVSDITYVHNDEGWLFLAIFLDLFTRKVVGFSSDDNMRVDCIERKSNS